MAPPRFPDRWLDYSKIGSPIPGTKFICFKTPVNTGSRHQSKVHGIRRHSTEFNTDDLIRNVSVRGWNLGLVIDLTNTTKYYNRNYIEAAGIKYQKIFCEGHVVPSNNVISNFTNTVNSFLLDNPTNANLVGVHCTHGVNRTSYIICRYLIEVLGYTAENALTEFSKARGHPLERQNYINDLHRRQSSTDQAIVDALARTPVPPEAEHSLDDLSPEHSLEPEAGTDDVATEHGERQRKPRWKKTRNRRPQCDDRPPGRGYSTYTHTDRHLLEPGTNSGACVRQSIDHHGQFGHSSGTVPYIERYNYHCREALGALSKNQSRRMPETFHDWRPHLGYRPRQYSDWRSNSPCGFESQSFRRDLSTPGRRIPDDFRYRSSQYSDWRSKTPPDNGLRMPRHYSAGSRLHEPYQPGYEPSRDRRLNPPPFRFETMERKIHEPVQQPLNGSDPGSYRSYGNGS